MTSDFGKYFEDLELDVPIKHSLSKTIFESDNNLFSLLTMNHHPVHLNIDYASKSQHEKILVVGTLVLSLAVGITVQDISGKAIANLGYEEVEHLGPVFVNDTIYVSSVILNKWETSKKNRGIVHVETVVENQNGKKVLSFRRKVLVPKRSEL